MADIIGEVRRNLRVTTSESSSPSQVRISICYSGDDASRAVEVVNALAKHYAEGHLAAPERAVLEKCRQAEGAAKRAREEFLEAKGRLEEFVEQTFADQQAWAEREQTRPPDPPRPTGRAPSPPPPKPSPPPPVDNPQRAELVKDLESLQRRRAQLLEDRTPLHPQVQDVEARIAQVNERLAAMPNQVPDQRLAGPPLPEAPALEPPPQESPPAVNGSPPFAEIAEQSAEALQDFRTLKQAVDQARERYDRLAERKRQAWQERLRLPRIELELAESCQAGPAASRPPRLGLLGLAAALAMAAGVGLISAGFDHDPTLTTPTQAEKAVPAAIVGVIPATDPRRTQAPDQRSESVGGLGKIIVGAVLVAICLGILVAIL